MLELNQKKGTIAYSLTKNMDQIANNLYSSNDVKKLANDIINIVTNDLEITDRNSVAKFVDILKKTTKKNLLLSTITTYMTGDKVA